MYFIRQYKIDVLYFLQNRQKVLNDAIGQLDGLPPQWDVVPAFFDLANQTNRSLGQNFDTNDLNAYYSALWQARCVRPSMYWSWCGLLIPVHGCKWACHGQCMMTHAMVSG